MIRVGVVGFANRGRCCYPWILSSTGPDDMKTEVLTPCADPVETEQVAAETRLWLERAVIGLNLCPFAKAVHVKRQIRFAITGAASADELLAELRHELALLSRAKPELIETTLLIHPLALRDFVEYNLFLPHAEATVRRLGFEGVMQIASFHPHYEFAGGASDNIENYTNRSPYPVLHLLREASVARAVAAFPDAADIFEKNIVTMRQLGLEGWYRLWMSKDANS